MRILQFSRKAELDFDEIATWTAQRFGPEQAAEYLDGFDRTFAVLLTHPQIGKLIPHARSQRRRIEHVSHLIVYRVLTDEIRIERIVHESRLFSKIIR